MLIRTYSKAENVLGFQLYVSSPDQLYTIRFISFTSMTTQSQLTEGFDMLAIQIRADIVFRCKSTTLRVMGDLFWRIPPPFRGDGYGRYIAP